MFKMGGVNVMGNTDTYQSSLFRVDHPVPIGLIQNESI